GGLFPVAAARTRHPACLRPAVRRDAWTNHRTSRRQAEAGARVAMAEHVHHPRQPADVDHEKSDVNIRAILGFAGGLIGLVVVIYLVVWLLFVYLERREDRASSQRTYPLAVGLEDRLPPEPRLQNNPKQDLRDLRHAEDE